MKQNKIPQQTHFIGVLLPENITLTLEDCRRYMNEVYGCKSGHGTPIHVTLVPPFRLQEEYSSADLISVIEKEVLPKGLGFTAHIILMHLVIERFLQTSLQVMRGQGSVIKRYKHF